MKLFGKTNKDKSIGAEPEVESCSGCDRSCSSSPEFRGMSGAGSRSGCDSTDVIKKLLCAIQKSVNEMNVTGFSVSIELTTETGIIYPVTFTAGTVQTAQITECSVITANYNITLSSITKIVINTSALSNVQYTTLLEQKIQNILSSCGRDGGPSSRCAQCLQNFINLNKLGVDSISYKGGMQTIQPVTAATGVDFVNVVGAVSLTAPTSTAVASVDLVPATSSVVGTVTPANTNVVTGVDSVASTVVTGITPATTTVTPVTSVTPVPVLTDVVLENTPVVTGVATTPATASAPINLTPTPVVGAVATNPAVTGVIVSVGQTPATVLSEVTPVTAPAVTGLGTPTDVTGVISGVTAVGSTATTEYTIPTLTPTGATTGVLSVVIPAGSIDPTPGALLPATDVTLQVQLGTTAGSTITLGASSTAYALPATTTLLTGITGTPAVSDLAIPTTPTTADFMTGVTPATSTVVGSIDPVGQPGTIVASVTPATVNSTNFLGEGTTVTVVGGVTGTPGTVTNITSSTPTTINNPTIGVATPVLTAATPVTATVNTLGDVAELPASGIFSTTPATVLGTGTTILDTTTPVVTSAAIAPIQQTVVENVSTSTISVMSPVNESIDGTVTCAGNGIVAVDNTDGDISLYSVCDITSVNTEA